MQKPYNLPKKQMIRVPTLIIICLSLGLIGGSGLGYRFGQHKTTDQIQREAVLQQMAHYDPQTAAFKWGPASAGIVLADTMPDFNESDPIPVKNKATKQKGNKKHAW